MKTTPDSPPKHKKEKKASSKTDPPVVPVTDQDIWALVDCVDDKPEGATVVVSVQPAPKAEKEPSERARSLRISKASDLTPFQLGKVIVRDKDVLIFLDNRQKKICLPIAIGKFEGLSMVAVISEHLSNTQAWKKMPARDRGQIFDVLKSILDHFDITFERAVIDLLQKDTFFALGCFHRGKTVKRPDARPSDAIALGLRMGANIEAHRAVLDRAGLKMSLKEREKGKQEINRQKQKEGVVRQAYGLKAGQSIRLDLASRRKFVWKSSDTGVVSVTQDGILKGIKKGRATITAVWSRKK